MRRIIALAALALAGCQTPPAPPSAPAAIDARGTEPFWALRIRGDELTLLRPEQPDLTARAGADGAQTWSGRTADGRILSVRLGAGPCSDGMSDLVYPMTAEVSLSGEEVLRGCAAPAGALPKEGR